MKKCSDKLTNQATPQTAAPVDSPSESAPVNKDQLFSDSIEHILKFIPQLEIRITDRKRKNNRPDTCSISKAWTQSLANKIKH